VNGQSVVTTYFFTDVEGSTRLWERDTERMREALARHDAITRAAVEGNRGVVVKTSGDGVHAAFEDPLDAIRAAMKLQRMLADPVATNGVVLRVRCGIHVGVSERRENDYFGPAVNRAARIMSVAHGGQVLLSEAAATLVRDRLPIGVSLRDLGAVRLRDLSKVEYVYQVSHSELRETFPALRSLEATPNNLPLQVTSFIGREREIADARKALGTARLLTLHGAGGIGKTRLSLQVAADVLEDYPDGVWLVELAPLTDERLVPQAVASVMGVKEEAGHHVTEALITHVADRRLLIVLDNCEHVVHACAALAEQLLGSGTHLRILASSREPLRISGEVSFPVPALAVPAMQDPIAVEVLLQYQAVQLFIDRAIVVRPTFALTADNAPAVADICQRLDGIPLAIELAAARARALSVETIAARLNDRFRLLTGGVRTALPRQQTLRALIDWSYDLLSDKERILLRRLAVFAGGWTLEAAEAVGVGEEVREPEVMDLLADLVDKSLVMVEPERGRYRLLETVRQYAEERLAQSAEGSETRSRHVAFYLAFAEKVAPQLLGPEQADGLLCLDLERENILAAHGWCLRNAGCVEQDYRLVHAIKHYWFRQGLLNLGYRVTVEAVANFDVKAASVVRCKALWAAGQICSFIGRYDEAQTFLQESLSIARTVDDSRVIGGILNTLGLMSFGQGECAAARMFCEEALEIAEKSRNKRQITTASNALAQLHRLAGEIELAEPLYERSVALARELGDREFTAIGLLNLAMVAIARCSDDRAGALLREILAIVADTASRRVAQSALDVSVGLACLRLEWERAARYWGAAETLTDAIGVRRDPADEVFVQPMIAATREALGLSRFSAAEASGRALSFQAAVADASQWVATI
jgi:predicted ATPase/class 3 adenylate cyclase